MSFTIVTTTNAIKDIRHAIDWENERNVSLGDRFLYQLRQKFNALSTTPHIGSVLYDNIRCTTTNVFEYIIHYKVNVPEKEIIILRVLHVRRKVKR